MLKKALNSTIKVILLLKSVLASILKKKKLGVLIREKKERERNKRKKKPQLRGNSEGRGTR